MKSLLLSFVFSVVMLVLHAQDTSYFAKGNIQVPKNQADFYKVKTYNPELNRVIIAYYSLEGNMFYEYAVLDSIHEKRDGFYKEYYKDGQLKYSKKYKNNLLNGRLTGYYENGVIRRIDFYRNDTLIEGQCFTRTGKDTTHFEQYIPAGYATGNLADFGRYLQETLQYPEKARKQGIEGRVFVNFIIEVNGKITNVKPVKSINKHLDKEAVRVVRGSSGNWKPAIIEGVPSRILYTVPINFKLE